MEKKEIGLRIRFEMATIQFREHNIIKLTNLTFFLFFQNE